MNNLVKVTEVFLSPQGEVDVGMMSIFIRFSGCNLIHRGLGCDFCDSKYAEQGKEISIDGLIKEVVSFLAPCDNIVITGGESMVQKEGVFELMQTCREKGFRWDFNLETNGTIYDSRMMGFRRISCSPKRQAIDMKVLKRLSNLPQVRFKFVYESRMDRWWEGLIGVLGIGFKKVWIMPEGITRDKQLKLGLEVMDYCRYKGYNFSPRLHILYYGNQRGV